MAMPERGGRDVAKAMTMVKRLTIFAIFRRTELDRTGSILPSRFAIACGAAARNRSQGATPNF
jgi:hypothetical protein